jgi:hypothetical protein
MVSLYLDPHLPFSLYYRLSGILTSLQEVPGTPGLPRIHNVRHAMPSDPGEVGVDSPFRHSHWDFRYLQSVVLPT